MHAHVAGAALGISSGANLLRDGAGELLLHPKHFELKDFLQTSFKGTVGAAVAFIEMQRKGYVWKGHWEDLVPGPYTRAHPDFIFATTAEVSIVDAKGTAGAVPDAVKTAKEEWRRQIWANRNVSIKGFGRTTEGHVVTTMLSTTIGARLIIAHGKFPAPSTTCGGPSGTASSVKTVQRANYAEVAQLIGLPQFSRGLGRSVPSDASGGLIEEISDLRRSIDHRGDVVLGPALGVVHGLNGIPWQVQPFCRLETLELAEAIFLRNKEGLRMRPFPFEKQLPTRRKVIVQGRDGAGALFTPMLPA